MGSLFYSGTPAVGESGFIVTAGHKWLMVSWDASGLLLVRASDVVPIDDEHAA